MDEGKQRKMDKIREWGKAALFILVMIPVGLAILACALAARAFARCWPGNKEKKIPRTGCQRRFPRTIMTEGVREVWECREFPEREKRGGKGGSL